MVADVEEETEMLRGENFVLVVLASLSCLKRRIQSTGVIARAKRFQRPK